MRASANVKRNGSQTPRFGYLLRLALESIGVHYVSVEVLRKAKKNQTTKIEYWTLWRLLHDFVLVVLVDFEVEVTEMEKMNEAKTLERELLDPELHDIQMELVRFYLYEWGFLCTAFYSKIETPSSQVMLLAVAWLLAFSQFFEKQHQLILQVRKYLRYTGSDKLPQLPPFPNDIDLDDKCVRDAALTGASNSTVSHDPTLPLEGEMHRLHSAFGRLMRHLNELKAYNRYHQRLVERLEMMQNKSEEDRDQLIPALILKLLAGPPSQLADQVRVLSQSLQIKEDEAQFYKWINGLVLSLNSKECSVSPIPVPNAGSHSELHAQIQEVQALFQAHTVSCQKIEQSYREELKKWVSRQKSRSRVQQMETKVERFTHEVQTRELFDAQKLFLFSQHSWEASSPAGVVRSNTKVQLATLEDVEQLQSQVASVISEITREYCDLQLQ